MATKKAKVDLSQFQAEVERKAYEIYEDKKINHERNDDFLNWLEAVRAIEKKYGVKEIDITK